MLYPDRVGIFVYLYYGRDARKLNKFGDFHYLSKRGRYVLLYIHADDVDKTVQDLSSLKFVKEVRVSHLNEVDRDFVGNLNR